MQANKGKGRATSNAAAPSAHPTLTEDTRHPRTEAPKPTPPASNGIDSQSSFGRRLANSASSLARDAFSAASADANTALAASLQSSEKGSSVASGVGIGSSSLAAHETSRSIHSSQVASQQSSQGLGESFRSEITSDPAMSLQASEEINKHTHGRGECVHVPVYLSDDTTNPKNIYMFPSEHDPLDPDPLHSQLTSPCPGCGLFQDNFQQAWRHIKEDDDRCKRTIANWIRLESELVPLLPFETDQSASVTEDNRRNSWARLGYQIQSDDWEDDVRFLKRALREKRTHLDKLRNVGNKWLALTLEGTQGTEFDLRTARVKWDVRLKELEMENSRTGLDQNAHLSAQDGADVIALLNEPGVLVTDDDFERETSDAPDVNADDLFGDANHPCDETFHYLEGSLRKSLPEPPMHGQVSRDNPLNLAPEEYDDDNEFLASWKVVLDRYTDDVWDDASRPWIQEAREEMKNIGQSERPLEQREQDDERSTTVRRLRQILGHVTAPRPKDWDPLGGTLRFSEFDPAIHIRQSSTGTAGSGSGTLSSNSPLSSWDSGWVGEVQPSNDMNGVKK